MAHQVLRLHDGQARARDKQYLRARNPTVRRVPKSNQRIPLRLGSRRPRRISIAHQHSKAPYSHSYRCGQRARLREQSQRYGTLSANLLSNYVSFAVAIGSYTLLAASIIGHTFLIAAAAITVATYTAAAKKPQVFMRGSGRRHDGEHE